MYVFDIRKIYKQITLHCSICLLKLTINMDEQIAK